MEGLVRLVAESIARHHMSVPPANIDWSPWVPLESKLCLTAPSQPGIFVVAERMVASGLTRPVALATLKISQTPDLGVEMARLCDQSPLRERIATGLCLVRFATVVDDAQRVSACAALQQWFTHAPEILPGKFSAEPLLASSAHQHQPGNPAPLPSGF
jgi:hypothetical protein